MSEQPKILLSPPHMSGRERELVSEVFDSNFLAPAGPMIDRFEQEFCSFTGHTAAVALSSGTGAMDIALRLLGVGADDEVWVSDLTFIGGVSPIIYRGAKPVFLDVSRDTWTLDVALLTAELEKANQNGRLPKAVIPVDLYGQSCDLDPIVSICAKYDVPVVVDSAEAMGATYKDRHAGIGAALAVYSFNGNKIMTTAGGGMLAGPDEELISRARYLAQQARQPVAHYEHTETGYNYRMPSLCAAVGVGQLEVLRDRVARRREIFEVYAGRLSGRDGIEMMPEASYGQANRWLSVLTMSSNDVSVSPEEVCQISAQQGVECRPVWKPMSQQPVFKNARSVSKGVSDNLYRTGLCLPSGSAMSDADLERAVSVIESAMG
ncbi:aminotransferase class I/II-fold pyridoxal phosphate-dependent enzyme [Parvibaculaceae bacterium PLY_AMNH_Bact1]|nr:aminotransferase class I/II-fold pyridoxal phosphate-dependent enzyme [Parvibaculaceae bacterium PLY_AMNH_Bact1]